MWDRRAKYLDNYDGDTVSMVLDQGFHSTLEVDLRLANVWAPEANQPGGAEVQLYVQNWLRLRTDPTKDWNFIVWTHRMKRADREQKSFDRYIATVMSEDGTESLNADVMKFIINQGYTGGVGWPANS